MLVSDDPLEDVRSLRNAQHIWKEGQLMYRADAEHTGWQLGLDM
jgi:hypothetical protein